MGSTDSDDSYDAYDRSRNSCSIGFYSDEELDKGKKHSLNSMNQFKTCNIRKSIILIMREIFQLRNTTLRILKRSRQTSNYSGHISTTVQETWSSHRPMTVGWTQLLVNKNINQLLYCILGHSLHHCRYHQHRHHHRHRRRHRLRNFSRRPRITL